MMKMTMKLHDSAVAGHGRSALPFKKRSQVVDSNSDLLSNNDDENIPLTETKLKRFVSDEAEELMMKNEHIPLMETKLKRFVSEEANEVSTAQWNTRETCAWTMADSSATKSQKAEDIFESKSNDAEDVPLMETTLKRFVSGEAADEIQTQGVTRKTPLMKMADCGDKKGYATNMVVVPKTDLMDDEDFSMTETSLRQLVSTYNSTQAQCKSQTQKHRGSALIPPPNMPPNSLHVETCRGKTSVQVKETKNAKPAVQKINPSSLNKRKASEKELKSIKLKHNQKKKMKTSPTSTNEAVILPISNLKENANKQTSVPQKKSVCNDGCSSSATSKVTLDAEKAYKRTTLTEDTEDGSSGEKQRKESNTVFDQGKIQTEPSPSNTTLELKHKEANGNASCGVMNEQRSTVNIDRNRRETISPFQAAIAADAVGKAAARIFLASLTTNSVGSDQNTQRNADLFAAAGEAAAKAYLAASRAVMPMLELSTPMPRFNQDVQNENNHYHDVNRMYQMYGMSDNSSHNGNKDSYYVNRSTKNPSSVDDTPQKKSVFQDAVPEEIQSAMHY